MADDHDVERCRTTLQECPPGHSDRFTALNNLANSLHARFEQQSVLSDLDEAIELHRAALDLRPPGHSDRHISLSSLAVGLRDRFVERSVLADLDEAIELHRAALELRPPGHSDRHLSLNNLALSLRDRFENQGNLSDLDEATELQSTDHKIDDKSPQVPIPHTPKDNPQAKMTLKGHEEWVNCVAFITGTHLLVTCSGDKSLRVWDLDTGKQVGEPLLGHDDRVLTVAASCDGRWIVSGAWNGGILVWEVATHKSVPVSFKGHESDVRSVVFSPDSETFATASYDRTVCVWQRGTGNTVLGPLRVGTLANSVSYSPDGRKLAVGTDEHIIVWDAANGERQLQIEQRACRVAFTPDGRRLISGNINDIRLSDAATGDIIKCFNPHTAIFLSLAIAPNGTKFATTSFDRTTQFFDLTTFEPIGEPLEHPDTVYCVAIAEDSQVVATGCRDNLVRTWAVPQSESEKVSDQSMPKILEETIPGLESGPEDIELSHRFFDDYDTRSPPQRNGRSTSRHHVEGFRIKKIMNRLFSRSSVPQGHTPRPRRNPIVDVFATRGKYRNANAISGKRHSTRPPRPPRQQAHTSNTGNSAPPAGTSNIGGVATPATLQTTTTDAHTATGRPVTPPGTERVAQVDCLAILAGCFPRLWRTRQTGPGPVVSRP